MEEYISKTALKELFEEDGHLSAYVEEMIDSVPVADAVPIVRCAKCANAQHDDIFGGIWCKGRKVEPEFYCADGREEFQCHTRKLT